MNGTSLAVAALLAALSVSANASLLVYEPFAYPDGWLTGQGEALEIRLLAVDFTDGKGVDFDDVRPIVQGPPPDPYIVALTPAVNNEGSGRPDKKSMMTFDVYDNACKAAEAVTQATYDPGDVNRDCVTDAKDLAELAGKWLTYIGLTEPVLK
jgi:hypothetical protein